MKLSTTAAIRSHSSQPAEGVDMRLLEQLFDHTPDTAFFIKDAAGYYLAVNHFLLERHGLRDKSQMLGRRPCDICPGDFGRIPAEQDAYVLRTGRPSSSVSNSSGICHTNQSGASPPSSRCAGPPVR